MVSLEELTLRQEKVCVVGLGYVGLPLAVLLANHFDVVGFDIDAEKIAELKNGRDRMGEVSSDALKTSTIVYESRPSVIAQAKVIIVAVPTPVDGNNIPDMTILKQASHMVGEHLTEGSIVVFESTVYPGATEEICIPIMEEASGKEAGTDFFVGYSPERVNPGDKVHTIDNIVKVVSGMDEDCAAVLAGMYEKITNVHIASSIKVAEAAKIIENTQRDINIALMNELSCIFHKMGIDTYEVLEAAGTKWNFLKFEPGLVGGHCIGVDPYYLTYKAQELGHKPQIILAGREINDGMHEFVIDQVMRSVMEHNDALGNITFGLWGITFKEDVPDVRNSKAAALYEELKSRGVEPIVHDPVAIPEEVEHEYGMTISEKEPVDILIVAVKHKAFKDLTIENLLAQVNPGGLVVDIKHLYAREEIESRGYRYWSL